MTGTPVALSEEEFLQRVLADRDWRNFTVDSRQVQPGAVFFALPGQRSDGHSYIPEAISAGARAVVLRESWFHSHKQELQSEAENSGVALVTVHDSLSCLQSTGSAVLSRSDAKKIGITGSNGKTSTKDLLVRVLSVAGSVHYSKGNLNSDIGLPLCTRQNS